MNKDDQMIKDLIEIFNDEYDKRNLITAQNTADKMTTKGYRKASEVAREIFEEIKKHRARITYCLYGYFEDDIEEIEKKYTEGER